MLMTTTSVLEGRPVQRYLGIVTGEAIIGANIFRDMFATVRDIVGGRSATYEKALAEARDVALSEMTKRAEMDIFKQVAQAVREPALVDGGGR